jgi:hypothetical protein
MWRWNISYKQKLFLNLVQIFCSWGFRYEWAGLFADMQKLHHEIRLCGIESYTVHEKII